MKMLPNDRTDTIDRVWREFFSLELHAGMRRGELCGLRWCDVDFAAKTVSVNQVLSKVNSGVILISGSCTMSGNEEVILKSSFQLQKRALLINPSGIAGEAAAFPDNPMAGNDDGNLIVSNSAADRLGGHAGKISLLRQLCRNLPIGCGFSIGNASEE